MSRSREEEPREEYMLVCGLSHILFIQRSTVSPSNSPSEAEALTVNTMSSWAGKIMRAGPRTQAGGCALEFDLQVLSEKG